MTRDDRIFLYHLALNHFRQPNPLLRQYLCNFVGAL